MVIHSVQVLVTTSSKIAVIAKSEERMTKQSRYFSRDCFGRASLAMAEEYDVSAFDQLSLVK